MVASLGIDQKRRAIRADSVKNDNRQPKLKLSLARQERACRHSACLILPAARTAVDITRFAPAPVALSSRPEPADQDVATKVPTAAAAPVKSRKNLHAVTGGTGKKTAGADYINHLIAGDGVGRWPADKFPLKVYLDPGNGVDGFRPSFKEQLVDALNEWARASNGTITWREVSTPARADIVCRWTARNDPGRDDEAGYTESEYLLQSNSTISLMQKAEVTIVTKDNGASLTDKEVRKIALHELGHALGYQGHSPFAHDIMYQSDSPHQTGNLSQRDLNSIRKLYNSYTGARAGKNLSLVFE